MPAILNRAVYHKAGGWRDGGYVRFACVETEGGHELRDHREPRRNVLARQPCSICPGPPDGYKDTL